MYICVRTRLLVCVSVLDIAVYTGIFVEGECTCVVGVCACGSVFVILSVGAK